MSTTAQQQHAPVIALASEWLQTYRTLIHAPQQATVPQKTGSPYEDWATLTIVYMLLGFSRNMFPVTQLSTIVPTPDDFVSKVGDALRVLEKEAVCVANEKIDALQQQQPAA